jgi:hypothetical protein
VFYTYAHYKPEGGLFYIGKGKRRRAYQMDGRNSHWQNIVHKYGKPHVELLASWKTEEEAFSHEKLLIASFRDMGFVLANKSDGGEGSSGYKHTEESKRKNSLAKMGHTPWNKGKIGIMPEPWNKGLTTPLEVRQKQSIAKQGKPSPRKGVVLSDEIKANMSASKIGKVTITEAGRKALSLAHTGRKYGTIKCPHCDKIGGLTAMPRWHFDNCKLKGK